MFLRYLHFCPDFGSVKKNSLIRKLWLISKFKASQTGQQIITINILPNISRNKDNKANKFCHLIKFRMRNFFLRKSYRKQHSRTSRMEVFCKNSERVKAAIFAKKNSIADIQLDSNASPLDDFNE